MKILRKLLLILCMVCFTVSALASGTQANLTKRLSTRSGPSTDYTEPGTFFSNNWDQTTVRVLSKAQGSSVWWVQVEFSYGGKLYRAYTGEQRVALDLSHVPEERPLGHARLTASASASAWYGPGTNYAPIREAVPYGVSGTVIASENGYLLFDFFDSTLQKQRRAWLLSSLLDVSWYGGHQPSNPYPDTHLPQPSGQRYYWNQDYFSWCEINSRASAGGYSTIDLHIDGVAHFHNVQVYMQGSDYGTLYLQNGSGTIWFYSDRVIIDLSLPSHGVHELMQMLGYQ